MGWRLLFLLVIIWLLGGCQTSLWESYANPDNRSTRADRICHPYGYCSQGEWVSLYDSKVTPIDAQRQCAVQVDHSSGNGWWKDSVSRGLEIGACMEKMGYILKQ